VDILIGDASKAQKKLGWKPNMKFKELVKLMVDADMQKEELKLNGSANYKKMENYVVH
jgi:GDPmannose 4,6-dehydratase